MYKINRTLIATMKEPPMTYLQVDAIRKRVWHSISQTTADQAGDSLTQANLQQYIAGTFLPTDAQLKRLAAYLGVKL